jgi:D-alanyl-lipoteichoic acid acyltransferase DltB (MBOAT superfamily)
LFQANGWLRMGGDRMPFSSYIYIVAFLPIACLVFWALQRRHLSAALWSLIAAAAVFYVYWHPPDIVVALGSFVSNFLLAQWIMATRRPNLALGLAIAGNLLLLGYFKYTGFVVGVFSPAIAAQLHIFLPLGISFFTFTQIAYLCDCHAGKVTRAQHTWRDYLTFVSFFPHLIAGPILHHATIMPQLQGGFRRDWQRKLGAGLVLFAIGLFKKVVIADHLSDIANPVFAMADAGHAVGFGSAWMGALAYTLQIYFDFSGYSDMAVASALFVGFNIPFNFNSPYQAGSIIEFWKRWHITLSSFLRDYLYVPLGGNRRGTARRYLNVFVTMLLGGVWHGAGWTFIIWGALHASFIVINHLWRDFGSPRLPGLRRNTAWRAAGYATTMLCVLVAWVFFRAQTASGAVSLIGQMASPDAAGVAGFSERAAMMLLLGGLLAGFAPNSWRIHDRLMATERLHWGWIGTAAGVAFAIAFVSVSIDSPFLYFQF